MLSVYNFFSNHIILCYMYLEGRTGGVSGTVHEPKK